MAGGDKKARRQLYLCLHAVGEGLTDTVCLFLCQQKRTRIKGSGAKRLASGSLQRSASEVSNPSLERHGLFINQFVATGVLEILWQLFRHGGLDYSELYFNLKNGRRSLIRLFCGRWTPPFYRFDQSQIN